MRSDVNHFNCDIADGIATVSLDRPDRKNPLTFDSYAELRDWFRDLHYTTTRSRPSSLPPMAAISRPAAMCMTSSDR